MAFSEVAQEAGLQFLAVCVWLLLAFVATQIGAVIGSLIARRKTLQAKTQGVANECKQLLRKMDHVEDELQFDKPGSGTKYRMHLTRSCRPERMDALASADTVLTKTVFLTAMEHDRAARVLVDEFIDQHCYQADESLELGIVATQLGLLGTVVGAIDAFAKLSASQGGNAMLATLGALSFALWTTAVGLILALCLRLAIRWILKPAADELQCIVNSGFQELRFRILRFDSCGDRPHRRAAPVRSASPTAMSSSSTGRNGRKTVTQPEFDEFNDINEEDVI